MTDRAIYLVRHGETALNAGCAQGGLGDIGRSCDKRRDTRRADGRNELGSNPLRSRSEPWY
jgi:broad specificity phosphatase PhoE